MDQVEVELYAHQSNFAVLRLPTRRFPGVLIQGDSLSVLCQTVAEARSALDSGDAAGARAAVESLAEALNGQLHDYVRVLDEAGISLPFNRSSPGTGPSSGQGPA